MTDVEEKIIAFDAAKMERILLNLISNAVKFSNPNGTIFVNVSDKDNFVEISVKDTGEGIDKEYLDSIFERFRQVDKYLVKNKEGSGIGLSLTKSIVDLHGGKIKVESEIGKGSTFIVCLPVRTVENTFAADKTSPPESKIDMINIEFSDIYQF